MQLSFRLDKRPGESHLALDGKKRSNQLGFLAEVKGTFPSIPACLCVCLPVCLSAADPSVYASTSICLQ